MDHEDAFAHLPDASDYFASYAEHGPFTLLRCTRQGMVELGRPVPIGLIYSLDQVLKVVEVLNTAEWLSGHPIYSYGFQAQPGALESNPDGND